MKKLLFILTTIILLASCKENDKPFDNKNYEANKESLADREKSNPETFLVVSSKDRKNLIGQRVVKGSIKNNAKVIAFKDVEMHFTYYSKTGVKIDENLETIYEVIEPGKTQSFKSKYFAAKGVDSVAIKITKAVPVETK